jgi:ABC-2 type transport system ATP-binding protein
MNKEAKDAISVRVDKLSRSYGNIRAVQNVSFNVLSGEIFGVVGPDGAGKTTLLRTLCGLLRADSGHVQMLGIDALTELSRLKDHLGYMPQRFSLYEDLTLRENLDFFASIFGLTESERLDKIDYFLQLTMLTAHQKKLAGQLSGGMKQKLALAVNLIHRPDILLLDEPSTGVDPVARKEFWDVLREMRRSGTTILVATPYMEEAANCDRLLLIAQGQTVAQGAREEIIALFPFQIIAVGCRDPFAAKNLIRRDIPHLIEDVGIYGNSLRIATQHEDRLSVELSRLLPEAQPLQRVSATIEDAFVYLTRVRGQENAD